MIVLILLTFVTSPIWIMPVLHLIVGKLKFDAQPYTVTIYKK